VARGPEEDVEGSANVLPVPDGKRPYHACLEYSLSVLYSRHIVSDG
jgi:hypothetical protein